MNCLPVWMKWIVCLSGWNELFACQWWNELFCLLPVWVEWSVYLSGWNVSCTGWTWSWSTWSWHQRKSIKNSTRRQRVGIHVRFIHRGVVVGVEGRFPRARVGDGVGAGLAGFNAICQWLVFGAEDVWVGEGRPVLRYGWDPGEVEVRGEGRLGVLHVDVRIGVRHLGHVGINQGLWMPGWRKSSRSLEASTAGVVVWGKKSGLPVWMKCHFLFTCLGGLTELFDEGLRWNELLLFSTCLGGMNCLPVWMKGEYPGLAWQSGWNELFASGTGTWIGLSGSPLNCLPVWMGLNCLPVSISLPHELFTCLEMHSSVWMKCHCLPVCIRVGMNSGDSLIFVSVESPVWVEWIDLSGWNEVFTCLTPVW